MKIVSAGGDPHSRDKCENPTNTDKTERFSVTGEKLKLSLLNGHLEIVSYVEKKYKKKTPTKNKNSEIADVGGKGRGNNFFFNSDEVSF